MKAYLFKYTYSYQHKTYSAKIVIPAKDMGTALEIFNDAVDVADAAKNTPPIWEKESIKYIADIYEGEK